MPLVCSTFFLRLRGMAENNEFVVISNGKKVQTMCKKELFVVSAAIVMAMAMVMFFPATGNAGSPDPPSPPILNEVLNKLENIPPAWSQTLQCDLTACPRFELVMGEAAVLDHETGLVWQRTVNLATWTWAEAINKCVTQPTGDRWGWHLPTIEQLESLMVHRDPGEAPKLPVGHPFINVSIDGPYWTATTYTGTPSSAWTLSFGEGPPMSRIQGAPKGDKKYMWCVRGEQTVNHDQ